MEAVMVERGKIRGEMTSRQRQFCDEYMKDRNSTAAAKRAGYSSPSMPHKLMRHPLVRREIMKREQRAYEQSEVTVAEIVGRLAEIMRFDILDLCGEDGLIDLSDLNKLPKEARSCIKELDVRTSTDNNGNPIVQAKIKMYSKLEAADMLMRYFGGYKPEVLQQLVQLDWAKLEKREDITEDDHLTAAIASLDVTSPSQGSVEDAPKD